MPKGREMEGRKWMISSDEGEEVDDMEEGSRDGGEEVDDMEEGSRDGGEEVDDMDEGSSDVDA